MPRRSRAVCSSALVRGRMASSRRQCSRAWVTGSVGSDELSEPSRVAGRVRRGSVFTRVSLVWSDRASRWPDEYGHRDDERSEVDGSRGFLDVQLRADAQLVLDPLLDLVGDVRVLLQEPAAVLLALAELVALAAVPGAGLAQNGLFDPHVDERALAADAVTVEDVELGLLERRRDLVLHHLDARAVADHVGPVLQ